MFLQVFEKGKGIYPLGSGDVLDPVKIEGSFPYAASDYIALGRFFMAEFLDEPEKSYRATNDCRITVRGGLIKNIGEIGSANPCAQRVFERRATWRPLPVGWAFRGAVPAIDGKVKGAEKTGVLELREQIVLNRSGSNVRHGLMHLQLITGTFANIRSRCKRRHVALMHRFQLLFSPDGIELW